MAPGPTRSISFDRPAAIQGFTDFNVVGGTWTVSGGGLGWNVDDGAMQVAAGAVLAGTTVSSGGTLAVESGGIAAGTLVKAGGTEIIEFGGGKVVLSPSGNNTIEAGGITNTLINVNNTIAGAGIIGGIDMRLINSRPHRHHGLRPDHQLIGDQCGDDGGDLGRHPPRRCRRHQFRHAERDQRERRRLPQQLHQFHRGVGGDRQITSSTIVNGAGGVILASGSGAHVDLDGAVISGGTLMTSGTGAVIETISSGGGGVLDGSASSVTNLGTVLVNDDSALTLRGTIKNSGTIFVDNVNPERRRAPVHRHGGRDTARWRDGSTVE